MADKEDNSQTQPTNDRVSVAIEQDTTAVSFDSKGGTSVTSSGESLSQKFSSDGEALTEDDIAALEADGEGADTTGGDGQDTDNPEDTGESDEKETSDDDVELPDWDGSNEEVSSAYDAKYIAKDEEGKDVLNFEAFNAEFSKAREDGKRDLNAGTRAYLKERFGISDKLIDSHLAGVVAQEREMEAAFHSQFGANPEDGKKNYDAMFSWAKGDGGYSAAQKARYNEAMAAGGDAALEQIELLKTRYLSRHGGKLPATDTQDPKAGDKPGIGLKRRAVSPAKNATGSGTTASQSATPFATAEEHRVAQNAALRLTGAERTKKLEEVRERLKASTFWR